MPSGLSLDGKDELKEVARFEVVVYDNSEITISEEFVKKYGLGYLVMWCRHLAFNLEIVSNSQFVEQRLSEQLEELEGA